MEELLHLHEEEGKRYALNLSETNRVLSVTFEEFSMPEQPVVDELPDGDVTDYRYENTEFVYDPLPVPPEPEPGPTIDDVMAALLGEEE